ESPESEEPEAARAPGEGKSAAPLAGAETGRNTRCRVTAIIRHDRQRELMQRYGVDETVRVSRKDSQGDRYRRIAQCIGGQVIPTRFGHNAFIGGFDIVYDCVGTGESLT